MRLRSLLVFTMIIHLLTFQGEVLAQIKIGTNGNNIQPASILELESISQGLLLPRMANFIAIDALNPPVGMMVFITTEPSGIYVKKVTGWEHIAGSLGGNGNYNSLSVTGTVTAGSFAGPLTGNATSATNAINATNSLNSAVTNDISTTTPTFPVFVSSTPGNQGLLTSSGNLSYIPSTGILTARGFRGPLTGDVTGNATSSVDAVNTVNMRVTDNQVAPTAMYPTFVSGISGPLPPQVSSTGLSFVPLTGELSAKTFKGALIGNASTATTVTGNVSAVNGGTGHAFYSPGDLLYADASNTLAKLPVGVPGTILRVNGSNMPVWSSAGAGTVRNVIGTAGRISVDDPTVEPKIDIDPAYIGQSSITTLGTVAVGTWNAGIIQTQHGGTGQSAFVNNEVLLGGGPGNAIKSIPLVGTQGKVLMSNGPNAAPSFETPGIGDMVLAVDQPVTGIKRFRDGALILNGSGAGQTTLKSDANISGVITLPSGTRTLVGTTGVQTLTDKTLADPRMTGTANFETLLGNQLQLGTGAVLNTTNQTGTGSIVMSTGPTIANIILTGTANVNAMTASGTITAAGFNGTATNTQNVGTLAAAAVVTGINDVSLASVSNPNTIVRRDAAGDFSARVITAELEGNSRSATVLKNERSLFGFQFDGSADLPGIITGRFGGTGVDNGTRTISVAGNLITSGANQLTLTTTTTTNVTLPESGILYGSRPLSFTSATFRGSLNDPEGTGKAVFANGPELVKPAVSSLVVHPAASYNTTVSSRGVNVAPATTVNGSDLAGTVTVVMSGTGAVNNPVITVRYSAPFQTGSYPVLYPANQAAAGLTGGQQVFATGSQNSFTITSGTAGLTNGETYIWNYHIIGK